MESSDDFNPSGLSASRGGFIDSQIGSRLLLRGLIVFSFVMILGGSPAGAGYQSRGKRDPFVPLLTSEGQRVNPPGLDEEVGNGLKQMTLQGIVFDPKSESYAILNGRVVREKEEIDGMKILKIEPEAVTLLIEGQEHRLVLSHPADEKETP